MRDWTTAEGLDSIYLFLQERLSAWRRFHALGVAHLAVRLAYHWGVDPNKALLAALLHDIAKEMPLEEMRLRIEKANGGVFPETYLDYPSIWHALASEAVAREEFGLTCPEVCRAIRLHPTGESEMDPLERIIFLADFIDPTRQWEGVERLRQMARQNLVATCDAAIVCKTEFIEKQGKSLHIAARRALEEAKERMRQSSKDTACEKETRNRE